jgi:hypothetical protein
MNKIEDLFIREGLVQMRPNHRWFVMSRENSIRFIDACEKESIKILGIDGFYLHENGRIEPSMANSIDYSSQAELGINDIYKEAWKFIQIRSDHLYFEITCGE